MWLLIKWRTKTCHLNQKVQRPVRLSCDLDEARQSSENCYSFSVTSQLMYQTGNTEVKNLNFTQWSIFCLSLSQAPFYSLFCLYVGRDFSSQISWLSSALRGKAETWTDFMQILGFYINLYIFCVGECACPLQKVLGRMCRENGIHRQSGAEECLFLYCSYFTIRLAGPELW